MDLPEINIQQEEQFKAIKKAAEGGNVGSMIQLAELYEKGIGTDQDLKLAKHWRTQAGLS